MSDERNELDRLRGAMEGNLAEAWGIAGRALAERDQLRLEVARQSSRAWDAEAERDQLRRRIEEALDALAGVADDHPVDVAVAMLKGERPG